MALSKSLHISSWGLGDQEWEFYAETRDRCFNLSGLCRGWIYIFRNMSREWWGGRRNGHEMIIPGQAASGEAAFSIDAHYYITAFSISAHYQTWSHPPTLCHLCSCLSNGLLGQRAVKRYVAKVGIWDSSNDVCAFHPPRGQL